MSVEVIFAEKNMMEQYSRKLENEFMEPQRINSLKTISDLINKRARALESLHRHVTMLSSTLLGILAVFGGGESECPWFRWAMSLGALSLFLCLLCGIYCLWQYYKILDKAVRIQLENFRRDGKSRPELVEFPKLYGILATVCPASFCIGLLFLLGAVWLR